MATVTTVEKAMDLIKDGMTIMVGGFAAVGTPEAFMDELVKRGVKNLTIINNDTGVDGDGVKGVAKLINNGQVKKCIVSYVGLNRESGRMMNAGTLEIELVPQGTLAERIRAGGFGLGGVLTPTGVGTKVEEGKQTLEIDGRKFLLEKPLKADVALLKASKGDKAGNLIFNGATKNFNMVMATAADVVIAQVDELVEIGEIHPDHVMTPGIFVDYIVKV